MASAGMSDKGNEFKRLIATAMGVGEEEVEKMVPDLLEELEMSKLEDGGAVGGVDGNGRLRTP